MIIVGRDSFSEKLAGEMKAKFVKVETRVFPDGESHFRVMKPDTVKGQKVVLVVRGKTPGINQDKMFTEALFVLDKLNELGAKKTCLLLPYLPYARQDKEFTEGEVVSLKSVRKALSEKCDLMVNVMSHDFRKEGWVTKGVYNIDATLSAAAFLRQRNDFRSPVVIAPDMTTKGNVETLAKAINGETLTVYKKRDYVTGQIESSAAFPDLSGKDLIIFDDITSSGGTMFKAVQMGRNAHARRIICIAIHALSVYNGQFRKDSIELIRDESDEYYSSDTIETPVTKFSVIKQAAAFLKKNF
jgi:ribose-phosphate pyrophosphokinase